MPPTQVLDAGGAHISTALLDKIYADCQFSTGKILVVYFRSHQLQIDLFTAGGAHVSEVEGKRMTSLGRAWTSDSTLPLNVVIVEDGKGKEVGRIENLFPSCPVCLERRAEQALLDSLHAAGLLRTGAPRTLIHCEGKPVSETLIEDRG